MHSENGLTSCVKREAAKKRGYKEVRMGSTKKENGLHREEKVGSSFKIILKVFQFERYKQSFGPWLDVTPQAAVTCPVL